MKPALNPAIPQKLLNDIAKLDKLSNEDNGKRQLPAYGSWPESVHQFDSDSINALKAALAARRPLLLRGDPGTGKSQLARAAAMALGRLFVYEVVNAHTESQDLLGRFDAVSRLAEAQALQGLPYTAEERKQLLASKNYIAPGPLWWALCWQSADKVYQNSQYRLSRPEPPTKDWQPSDGSVLLIDEIDKANAELPNGLLEILGNNAVTVPWLQIAIGGKDSLPPLVIITTNEERELPAAFVRRCLVLNLELPDTADEFLALMVERGQLHYGDCCTKSVCRRAAEQLWQDRNSARDDGVTCLPGQAEYLDILRALALLAKDEAEQMALLEKIHKFALKKYPVKYGR